MTHWRDQLSPDLAVELRKIVQWAQQHPLDDPKDRLVFTLMNLVDAYSAARRLSDLSNTPNLKKR